MNSLSYYRIRLLRLISFLTLVFCLIGTSKGQTSSTCGIIVPPQSANDTPSEWGLTVNDRFGNNYNIEDLQISTNGFVTNPVCSGPSGVFELIFTCDFTTPEVETICQVFEDLSNQIVAQGSDIVISFTKASLGNGLGAASPIYLEDSYEGGCGIENSLIWEMINTGASYDDLLPPNFPVGVMQINNLLPNGTNWHTLDEDASPTDPSIDNDEYDLYSTVLHEAMHMLGFAARINNDGSPLNGFFSRWDRLLYGVPDNAFLITPGINPDCCNFHEFNSTAYPNLPGDVTNSCSGATDIVVTPNSLATVNADYGPATNNSIFLNILSHIDGICDNEPYVMHYSLSKGVDRRTITTPELDILCELGYEIATSGSCTPCMIAAVDDGLFVTNSGGHNLLLNTIIGNDVVPAPYTIEFNEGCGDEEYVTITPNSAGTGWIIGGLTQSGYTYQLCYTITGCNGECSQGFIYILRSHDFDLLDPCPPIGNCSNENLFCYGDFQDFIITNGTNGFYEMMNIPPCNPVYPGDENSPNIITETSGNIHTYIHANPATPYGESLIVPLTIPILPGCEAEVSFDVRNNFAWSNDAILEIYGSGEFPCDVTDAIDCPGNNNSGTFFCMASGISVTSETWQSAGTFSWTNNTSEPVHFITIVNATPTETAGANIDNLVITSSCENQLDVTSTILSACSGGNVEIEYEVCITGPNNTPTDVTLESELPILPGLQYGSGGDFVNGTTTITGIVPNGDCSTVILELAAGSGLLAGTEFVVGIELTASNACIDDADGLETHVILEDCVCPCPAGGLDITGSGPANASNISDWVTQNGIANSCISIEGTLFIDEHFTFFNCNIFMGAGAEIIALEGHSFSIDQCNIESCGDQLWNSITLQNNTSFMLRGSNVSGGREAITALDGSQFRIIENNFDRNFVGIFVPPNPGGNTVQGLIFKNNFTCTEDLLDNFDPVNLGPTSFAGIWLNNSTGLNIGHPNFAPNVNTFSLLRNGIVGLRSSFGVHHVEINDLVGQNTGFNNLSGVGVFTNGSLDFRMSNSNIHDAFVGVFAERSNMNQMEGCFMENVQDGIIAQLIIMFNQNTNIHDNEIHCRLNGIILRNLFLPSIDVTENQIFPGEGNTFLGIAGIRMFNTICLPTNSGQVIENTIHMDNTALGIEVNNGRHILLRANTITEEVPFFIQTNFNSGITLNGGFNNQIRENIVTGLGIPSILTGMQVNNAFGTVFCCNDIGSTRRGVAFTGTNDDTNLRTTSLSAISQVQLGLHLLNPAIIGDQFEFDPLLGPLLYGNIFGADGQNVGATHMGNTIPDVNASQFFINPGVPQSIPVPIQSVSGSWFFPSAGTTLNCAQHPLCNIPSLFSPIIIDDVDIKTAGGGSDYGAFTEGIQWEMSRYLLQKLNNNPSLLQQNQVVTNFYNNAQNTEIDIFNHIDSDIMGLHQPDSDSEQDLLEVLTALDILYNDLDYIDGLQLLNPDVWNPQLVEEKSSLLELIIFQHQKALDLINTIEQNRDLEIAAAGFMNSTISPDEIIESNLKTVNKIYFQTAAYGSSEFTSSQINELEAIAWKCPMTDGQAVYFARGLLSMVRDTTYDDELICSIGAKKVEYEEIAEVGLSENNFQLYPNPARDEVTFLFDHTLKEAVSLTIYNVTGQAITSLQVPAGTLRYSFNIKSIQTGIYFCRISESSKAELAKKLVIFR